MNKFKTKINYLIVCLAVILTFSLTGNVKAATNPFYYITTNVGETYETCGINYHSNEATSSVIYSTDAGLSNPSTVVAKSNNWSVETMESDDKTGFAARYVHKATLTGLSADTKYYYQIVSGNKKSEILSFRSGKNDGSTSNFLFLTDTQSYSQATFSKVESLLKAIEVKERNINMALITGDIVDKGGYESQWEYFYKYIPSLFKYQLATIPGNHEYYHSSDSSYIDASIYNQFFHNPQNGPTSKSNSSYYFKYDKTLIIMLDMIDRKGLKEHQDWFREVVKNNPSQWIIVGSHAGCFSTGVYDHDASYMLSNWQSIFEECQVDLALSGHEHIYARKDNVYSKSSTGKDENLGVTYLVGPATGTKQYSANNKEGFDEVNAATPNSANVIKVQGSRMVVTLYNAAGDIVTSFTLKSKRSGEITAMNDTEILNSIEYKYNKAEENVVISWPTDLWGNVSEISCEGNASWSQLIPSSNEAFTTHTILAVYDTYNYTYNLTITKTDGTKLSKSIFIENIKEPDPDPDPDPNPEPKPEKGCKKASAYLVVNIISISMLISLCFKKK